MWKALAKALAVTKRLQSRCIYTNFNCLSCGLEPEAICHVLINCLVARKQWSLAKILFPRLEFSQNSIFLNLHHLLACCENCSIPEHTNKVFLWILWQIWIARNTVFFERTRLDIRMLVSKAKEDAKV